jgi:hypothetical protein
MRRPLPGEKIPHVATGYSPLCTGVTFQYWPMVSNNLKPEMIP